MLRQLLHDICDADIDLVIDGDALKIQAPPNSLTAELKVRLASRKKQIQTLVRRAGGAVSALAIPRLVETRTPIAASPAQEALFFLDRLSPNNSAYNIEAYLDVTGPLSLDKLQQALNTIVARHEALRTRFLFECESVYQIIETDRLININFADYTNFCDEPNLAFGEAKQGPFRSSDFDLTTGYLFELNVVRYSLEQHVIHVVMHHIISDSWSLDVMLRELVILYSVEGDNLATTLPRLSAQPADFALQQQRMSKDQQDIHLDYWKTHLADAPRAINFSFDQADPAKCSAQGAQCAIRIPEATMRQLDGIAKAAGATPFMVLLTLYFIELSRWTGDDDIVVGTAIAARTHRHAAEQIGLFVNSIPLRFRIDRSRDYLAALNDIAALTVAAFGHQDLPFDLLVQALPVDREVGVNPIFQTMFVLQDIPAAPPAFSGLTLTPRPQELRTAKFPLSLLVQRDADGYNCIFEYAVQAFEAKTIERLAGRFVKAAKIIGEAPATIIGAIENLGDAEYALATSGWASGQSIDCDEATLFSLFAAQASKTPDAIAVKAFDGSLTYAQLAEKARKVAAALYRRGIGAGDVVALGTERSTDLLVGLLGTAAAGAGYLPIDWSHPPDRVSFMLSEAEVRLVLVDTNFADLHLPEGTELLVIAALCNEVEASPPNPPALPQVNATAYVIYTSGSTGTPKGVIITNSGLANYLIWARSAYASKGLTRGLVVTPIIFDATITSLLLPLITGAYVELLPDGIEAIEALAMALSAPDAPPGDYPLVKLSTAHLDMLRALAPSAAQGKSGVFVFYGDKFTSVQSGFWRKHAPLVRLVNEYGPTETVVGSTAFEIVEQESGRLVPIGRPIFNTENYVLDHNLRPLPLGTPGELYIGGSGVARGYVGNPALTAVKFVRNPFKSGNSKIYRSGDLVRWRHDGQLEFLGRCDDQLKIRGYRIEPGEVEAALLGLAEICQAFATAAPDAAGNQALVAYIVAAPGQILDIAAIRAELAAVLPSFMVPDTLVELPELPITANGKVDRRALPAPQQNQPVGQVPPVGTDEQMLAKIWCEVLGIETIGRHDDFFSLGGHSLLAVKMVGAVRERLERDVPLAAVFQYKTIAALALQLSSAPQTADNQIAPAPSDARIGLTSAQRGLWMISMFDGLNAAYNLSGGLRLRGALDKTALKAALDRLSDRHAALRTTIALIDDEPIQIITTADESIPLTETACSADALAEVLEAEGTTPFDIAHGPLVRARLLTVAPTDHVLVLSLHHLIADGLSLDILLNEFAVFYSAAVNCAPARLKPIACQFVDYAYWQATQLASGQLDGDREYWKSNLNNAPPLSTVPPDFARPAIFSPDGDLVKMTLDRNLTKSLLDFASLYGVTLFSVLLGVWTAILSRVSGQTDLVIGVPSANRSHVGLDAIVGLFVNTLPIRAKLGETTSFLELVAMISTATAEAQSHQDLPFEQIVETMAPQRDPAFAPFFQTMFAWQPTVAQRFQLADLDIEAFASPRRLTKFDLTLLVGMADGCVTGGFEFSTALYERSTIAALAARFEVALAAFLAGPEQLVVRTEFYLPGERTRLIEGWNQTSLSIEPVLVHELIARQVGLDPTAIAAVQGDLSLTFGELDHQAAQLATLLQQLGVGPDKLVAICADRTLAMLTGLLAVLKAGGAYVPLDPANPCERLIYMLGDADPDVILVSGELARSAVDAALISDAGSKRRPQVLDLADVVAWSKLQPLQSSPGTVGPDNLAYVIYTSGSTGRPKGVMIEHRQASNYLHWAADCYALQMGDRVPVNTSLAFDATVTSLLLPLICGATILLLPEGPDELPALSAALAEGSYLGLVKLTPSHLEALRHLDPTAANDAAARCFVVGGEALSGATAEYWYRAAPSLRIINEYGPTEATVGMIVHEVDATTEWDRDVPIGRPIANTRIYVLDGYQEPVATGIVGELYIGGSGVARGYLNQPELTLERFIPSPFVAGDRLYKTGDLCRYRRDGVLEFLGRSDDQIKIRGFRVELGEISARIAECRGVEQAAVVVSSNSAGGKQLIAYYTATSSCEEGEIVRHLGATLAAHMQPAAMLRIPVMPLTTNGKLDHRALPAPVGSAVKAGSYESPRGTAEETVAKAWQTVLSLDQISRNDDFFALGGHSFDAVKVIGAMRRLGFEANLQDLFIAPTVATFAAAVLARGNAAAPAQLNYQPFALMQHALPDLEQVLAKHLDVEDAYPLTPLQQGMLFHHLVSPERDPYVLSTAFRFPDRGWIERIVEQANAVISRHPALRTGFHWEELSDPVQVVTRQAALVIQEVQIDPEAEDSLTSLREICDGPEYRIDPREPPLARIIVAHDPANNSWIGIWKQHHLTVDHEASGLIAQEVLAQINGAPVLPVVPFSGFVAETRRQENSEDRIAFFRAMLGDILVPAAINGIIDVQGDDRQVEIAARLDPKLSQDLKRSARRHGVTTAAIFHVAWGLVLAATSDLDRVVFGTLISGRASGAAPTGTTIGLLLNTLPIRIDVDQTSVSECLRRTHGQLAELLRHQHGSLGQAKQCSGLPKGTPVFTTLLNFRRIGAAAGGAKGGGRIAIEDLLGAEILGHHGGTNYPAALTVEEQPIDIRLLIQTTPAIEPQHILEMLLAALAGLIDALIALPETPTADLLQTISGKPYGLVSTSRSSLAVPADPTVGREFGQAVVPLTDPGAWTRTQTVLQRIWSDVLNLDNIGLDDDFFALGGDSIRSIQIVGRARRHGIIIAVRSFFEHATIRHLAAVAEVAAPATQSIADVSGTAPLTPIQHWFFERRLADHNRYNPAFLMVCQRRIQPDTLQRVFEALVKNHDALRLRVHIQDGLRIQQIDSINGPISVDLVDLSDLPGLAIQTTIAAELARLHGSLNLERGPITRMALFEMGPNQPQRLAWIVHHVAIDGVSWRILTDDLIANYLDIESGTDLHTPLKSTSVIDAAWHLTKLARDLSADDLGKWMEIDAHLAQHGSLNSEVSAADAHSRTFEVEFDAATWADFSKTAQILDVSLQNLLITVTLRIIASMIEGRPRIMLVGHGRRQFEPDCDVSRTVGWFTAMHPLVVDVGTEPIQESVKRVIDAISRLPAGGESYGLARYLRNSEHPWRNPEVQFNFHGAMDLDPQAAQFFSLAEDSADDVWPTAPAFAVEVSGGTRNGCASFSFAAASVVVEDLTKGLAAGFANEVLRLAATSKRQSGNRG